MFAPTTHAAKAQKAEQLKQASQALLVSFSPGTHIASQTKFRTLKPIQSLTTSQNPRPASHEKPETSPRRIRDLLDKPQQSQFRHYESPPPRPLNGGPYLFRFWKKVMGSSCETLKLVIYEKSTRGYLFSG
jgi:hypothetical protein